MNLRDNRYAQERGLHTDGSPYRDETVDVAAVSGHAPPPGSESAGPSMFNLVQETRRAIEVQTELLKNAIPLLDKRIVVNYATGTTDGSGNLDLQLYQVAQGMQFVTTRVNVEDSTHTPGAGYTAAACWIALIRGVKFSQGSMVDFLPNPAAANGVILPCQFSDGPAEAAVFRGGENIGLHIAGGPVSTDIWVRIQGFEEPI